ncbi:DNA-3-methyladenine glycosylase II [Saccharomonospora amisosensis]|uniref:DNA-3-methyladenine glycosylase II n=1 Tax=Saccharomonospora amisosensis TaxID=1128677 RepID=A0A7X5ZPR7_9PSEU|nr:DNA-3-methyladenine glycosylase 2 family protein [Saccharomonospora amisosensis]NIJ11063.1 DNA-3-methyladenine glycosylase II [Saccharomonospora amisosensis]
MCAVSTDPSVESHIEVKVRGGIDLRDHADFLRHQSPGCRPHEGGEPATLCLGFTVEDTWRPVAARVRQRAPDVVGIDIAAKGIPVTAVAEQVRRILSLEADGDGFAALARRDPVLARLRRLRPGLRPVHFHSPYEAACFAVVCHRLRVGQAAAIVRRIAERHGERVSIGGRALAAFPPPEVLLDADLSVGLSEVKRQRLTVIARAALDGLLNGTYLRSLPPDHAVRELRRLPGIGPFSAEFVVGQGAGHPTLFPRREPRLHARMAQAYGVGDVDELERIARRYGPYSGWAAFVLRSSPSCELYPDVVAGQRKGGYREQTTTVVS